MKKKYKLIKEDKGYYILMSNEFIIGTSDNEIAKLLNYLPLSKQNCDELFGIVDVDKLAIENCTTWENFAVAQGGFIKGFNKAMELNKDKLFTVADVRNAIEYGIQSALQAIPGVRSTQSILNNFIQQQTEIEVEIEMELEIDTSKLIGAIYGHKPKLDLEGCLILKKI